jgi:Holliday junction resolvasome RuvABC endonuclease subunit
MRILALDLATKTGWAHSDGSSGVISFPGTSHPGCRWSTAYDWVDWMLTHHDVDLVVYEQAHHRGGPPTRCALGLISATEMAANDHLIPVKTYHTATIKKHATGKGNAQKHEMYAAAKKRNPDREFIDDNEIDALFLLDLALSELPAEREAT